MANHRYWRFIQVSVNILHAPRVCELRWVNGGGTVTPDSYTHGGTFTYNEDLWDTSFDGETNDSDIGWIVGNTGWIRCDFGVAGNSFTSFGAYSSYTGSARGANWNLQYSDDDSNWTTFKNIDYNTSSPFTGWFDFNTDISAEGTNMTVNVDDVMKEVAAAYVNVDDVWKEVASAVVNVDDAWKSIF